MKPIIRIDGYDIYVNGEKIDIYDGRNAKYIEEKDIVVVTGHEEIIIYDCQTKKKWSVDY